MNFPKLTRYIWLPLVFIGTPALAENCKDPVSQSAMTQCAGEAFKKADLQLNKAYNAYRARLNASQQAKLKAAQLAWIKFRDLSCDFESSGVEGGSAYAMVRAGCFTSKTEARLKEIQKLSACEEGDLSCPAPK